MDWYVLENENNNEHVKDSNSNDEQKYLSLKQDHW